MYKFTCPSCNQKSAVYKIPPQNCPKCSFVIDEATNPIKRKIGETDDKSPSLQQKNAQHKKSHMDPPDQSVTKKIKKCKTKDCQNKITSKIFQYCDDCRKNFISSSNSDSGASSSFGIGASSSSYSSPLNPGGLDTNSFPDCERCGTKLNSFFLTYCDKCSSSLSSGGSSSTPAVSSDSHTSLLHFSFPQPSPSPVPTRMSSGSSVSHFGASSSAGMGRISSYSSVPSSTARQKYWAYAVCTNRYVQTTIYQAEQQEHRYVQTTIYQAGQQELSDKAYSPVTTILEFLSQGSPKRQENYQQIKIYHNYTLTPMCEGMYKFVSAYSYFGRSSQNYSGCSITNQLDVLTDDINILTHNPSFHIKSQFDRLSFSRPPNIDLAKINKETKTHTIHRLYMAAAYVLANKRQIILGQQPDIAGYKVGAILTDNSGQILAWGINTIRDGYYTHHAEVNLIRRFLAKYQTVTSDTHYYLFTTLRCCAMCAGMVRHIFGDNITVYYGQNDSGSAHMDFARLRNQEGPFNEQLSVIKPLRFYKLDNNQVLLAENKPIKHEHYANTYAAFQSEHSFGSVIQFLNFNADSLFINIEAGLAYKNQKYSGQVSIEKAARKRVIDYLQPLIIAAQLAPSASPSGSLTGRGGLLSSSSSSPSPITIPGAAPSAFSSSSGFLPISSPPSSVPISGFPGSLGGPPPLSSDETWKD